MCGREETKLFSPCKEFRGISAFGFFLSSAKKIKIHKVLHAFHTADLLQLLNVIYLPVPMAGCSGLTLSGHPVPTKSSLSLPSATGRGEKM